MENDNHFAQAADLIWRRIGDDIVIITPDGQSTHILNKTAAIIWEASDGSAGIAQIARQLCERFEVSFEEARADVKDFVENMKRLNLLKHIEENTVG
jgi:hypothetical protein